MSATPATHRTPAQTRELLSTLRQSLSQVDSLVEALEEAALPVEPTPDPHELLDRIRSLEEDSDDLGRRLIDAEKQGSRVMNLYVATYQLHASLEPEEVQTAIAEIASDLLGARSFALLLRDEPSAQMRVAAKSGLDGTADARYFAGTVYGGGHAIVDATVASGRFYVSDSLGESTLATIPLTFHGQVIGVLVILQLLAHRSRPLSEEREMLDLLAAHAASALVAARGHAAATKKATTLEGLMSLLDGRDLQPGNNR